MEKYINEKTIIKDEVYNLFKDDIKCPNCKKIMIDPVMCLSCQTKFCKNCQKKLKKNRKNCPKKCHSPIINDVILKNNCITKFKFKCIKGCGKEISFDNIISHYNSDCKKKKIKIIDKKKAAEAKKQIAHIGSRFINFNIL